MDLARANSFRTGAGEGASVPAVLPRGQLRLLAHADLEDPAFLAAWERLVARAAEPNPFFEPWYLLPSLRQWGAAAKVRIKAWYHDGRLAGLLPVARTARYYGHPLTHAAGWLHANAFCGVPLVAAGYEEAFWRDLLAHFDHRPGRALFLHLPLMPEGGPVETALKRVLTASPRLHYVAAQENRAMLAGGTSAAAYVNEALIPRRIDHDPCAHWRMPMDMMRHG